MARVSFDTVPRKVFFLLFFFSLLSFVICLFRSSTPILNATSKQGNSATLMTALIKPQSFASLDPPARTVRYRQIHYSGVRKNLRKEINCVFSVVSILGEDVRGCPLDDGSVEYRIKEKGGGISVCSLAQPSSGADPWKMAITASSLPFGTSEPVVFSFSSNRIILW
jgi:hypothetical protein